MEKSISTIDEFVPLAVGIAVFILLWVIIFKSLKEGPVFKDQAAGAIVATCVSLLSIIGIFRLLSAGDSTYNAAEKTGRDGTNLDFILLLYATLGITIILLLLILLVHKFLGNSKSKKLFHKTERNTGSTFHFDLGKSDRSDQENFTEAFQEIEVGQDTSKTLKPIYKPSEKHVHHSAAQKETKSNRIKQ